jgi:sigma-B regulation protein RsbU (phosphoserine phosphatase)
MFCTVEYDREEIALAPGELLVLHSDGLAEARSASGEEFGHERLARLVQHHRDLPPRDLAALCLEDVRQFLAGAQLADDLTLLVLRRHGG